MSVKNFHNIDDKLNDTQKLWQIEGKIHDYIDDNALIWKQIILSRKLFEKNKAGEGCENPALALKF